MKTLLRCCKAEAGCHSSTRPCEVERVEKIAAELMVGRTGQ